MDRRTRRCLDEAEAKLAAAEPEGRTGLLLLRAFGSWLEEQWAPHNELEEETRALLHEHLQESSGRLTKIEDALFDPKDGLVNVRDWLCKLSRWTAIAVGVLSAILLWGFELLAAIGKVASGLH